MPTNITTYKVCVKRESTEFDQVLYRPEALCGQLKLSDIKRFIEFLDFFFLNQIKTLEFRSFLARLSQNSHKSQITKHGTNNVLESFQQTEFKKLCDYGLLFTNAKHQDIIYLVEAVYTRMYRMWKNM